MFYTVRGVARFLRISRSTVRNRQLAGVFPPPDDTVNRGGTVADIWARETLVAYQEHPSAWQGSK